MKHIKIFEQFEDDPFGEDTGNDPVIVEDLYIVKNLGYDDEPFITKKVQFPIGRWHDYKYLVMELSGTDYEFSEWMSISSNSAYPLSSEEISKILNDEIPVVYGHLNGIYTITLSELCRRTRIDKNCFHFMER